MKPDVKVFELGSMKDNILSQSSFLKTTFEEELGALAELMETREGLVLLMSLINNTFDDVCLLAPVLTSNVHQMSLPLRMVQDS